MENFIHWTDEQIEDLINRVYGGVVTVDNLPPELYNAILNRMTDAIIDGFGDIPDGVDFSSTIDGFQKNMKDFSFAKTFQQVNDMQNIIFDSSGSKIPFADFKKMASEVFDIYNATWLETEFNTAISVSQGAGNFLQFMDEKDALPLLKYVTAGDERVRASHSSLNGIIRPVDDPFWDIHAVPNDFNCRCIIEQLEEGEITDLKDKDIEEIGALFKNNPAKTGVVFNSDHPYFNGLGGRKNEF